MNTLHRITTEYDSVEDRIRITGELAENKKICLWMTQRLLSCLIPHLFSWLQQKQSPSPEINSILGFQQSEALQKLDPSTPRVIADISSQSVMVLSIDLKMTDKWMQVCFKTHDQAFAIPFTQLGLQQWLAIVFNTYQKANWHFDQWPLWLTQPSAPNPFSVTTLH